MSYKEISATIRKILAQKKIDSHYGFLNTPADDHIENNPLLDAILATYPPYGQSWAEMKPDLSHYSSQQVDLLLKTYYFPNDFESPALKNTHLCLPAQDSSSNPIALALLQKLSSEVHDPKYDEILLTDDRQTKEIDALKKESCLLSGDKADREPVAPLCVLQQNFRQYLEQISAAIANQKHGHTSVLVSQLVFLSDWLDKESPPQKHAYHALISRVNKAIVFRSKYREHRSAIDNLRFSLYILILEIEANKAPLVTEHDVIKALIAPFVQKDSVIPHRYHATPLLYQVYQQAQAVGLRLHDSNSAFEKVARAISTSELHSDESLITRMGQILGFGIEHIQLLLSIVGQDLATDLQYDDNTLPGLAYLKKWEKNAPFDIKNQKQDWDLPQAREIYLQAMKQHAMRHPCEKTIMSLLPLGFNEKEMIESFYCDTVASAGARDGTFSYHHNRQIRYFSSRRLLTYSCTADIFARLLNEKKISLQGQLVKNSLLRHFSAAGSLEAVQALFKMGANLTAQSDYYQDAPLGLAAQYGHTAIVRFLLNQLADEDIVQEDREGYTALINAVHNGHHQIAQLLLDRNSEQINRQNKQGYSALIFAAMTHNERMVELLLKDPNINVNSTNWFQENALMVAASRNSFFIAQLLLQRADINTAQKNSSDKTALDLTTSAAIKELLGHRSAATKTYLSEPLQLISAVCSQDIKTINALLESQYDVNEQNSFGQTALITAASLGYSEIVEKLLSVPLINVNATTIRGNTALIIAVMKNHPDIVRLLIQHPGVSPWHENLDGHVALDLAPNETIREILLPQSCPLLQYSFVDSPKSSPKKERSGQILSK